MVVQGNSPRKSVISEITEASPDDEKKDIDNDEGRDDDNKDIENKVGDNVLIYNEESIDTDDLFDQLPTAKAETMILKKKQLKKRALLKKTLEGQHVSGPMAEVTEEYIQRFLVQTGNKSSSKVFDIISEKGKTLNFDKNDFILETNELNEYLFLIIEGTVDILTSDNRLTIARLEKGEVFGEVSIMYSVPCTANVRAHTDVTVVIIEKTDVLALLENHVDIIDWFIKRRYFPTSSSVDAPRFYRRISLHILKKLPIFLDWPDDAIKALIMKIDHTLVILYPTQSVLLLEGDPIDSLYVLIEGTIEVDSESRRIATICISREDEPVVFGTTGVLVGNQLSCYTLKAVSNCKVIKVHGNWVNEVAEKYQQKLQVFQKKAPSIHTMMSSIGYLYEKYRKYLDFDLMFYSMSSSDFYKKHSSEELWMKTTSSVVQDFDAGAVILHDNDAQIYETYLVVRGMVTMKSDLEKTSEVKQRNDLPLADTSNEDEDVIGDLVNEKEGLSNINRISATGVIVKDGQLIILPENRESRITLEARTWCLVMKIKRKPHEENMDVYTSEKANRNSPDKILANSSLEFV